MECLKGQNAESLGLSRKEVYNIELTEKLSIGQIINATTECTN